MHPQPAARKLSRRIGLPFVALGTLLLSSMAHSVRADEKVAAFREGIIRELADIGSPTLPFDGGSFSAAIPSENGTQGVVPVEGLENLSVATQVRVAKATKWPWDAQVSAKSAVPIPKDTVLYATFFARWSPAQKAAGGQSGGNIRVELKDLDAAPCASPINRIQPEISETWQRYHLRGVVVKDIAAGRGELLFSLGSLPQTIEVAGVTLLAFPPETHLKRLPRNILNLAYAGRAADAPWRAEAAKKIDEIRKGDLTASLDRFARFGLPIHISELDVDVADTSDPEQLAWQRDMFRDALTVFFAHPSVNAITQWGFWEGAHWKKRAALWDKNWNLRAHGQAYRDLVLKDWWTETTLPNDEKGLAKTRGFLGDYKVTVTANGKTSEVTAKLAKGCAALEVVLN
jgi:hypothetical protein